MSDINSSLCRAVYCGNLIKVRELVNTYGLSYSKSWSDGYVLLRTALEKHYSNIAKFLLQSGSKVNSKSLTKSQTPLHFAIINGDIKIIKMLLDRNANVNAQNVYDYNTPLHIAIENKLIEIIELILSKGADIHMRNKHGMDSLHIATFSKTSLQIVECLFKRGALINSVVEPSYPKSKWYKEGYTPLHFAIFHDQEDIVQFFLNNNANVNVKASDGKTPLHIAVEIRNLQIVESLLKSKALVNILNNDGYSPLLLAVKNRHEKVVKLLLEFGANVDDQDKDGKSILQFAVEERNSKIVEHIIKHCPDVNSKSNNMAFRAAIMYDKYRDINNIVENLYQYGFTLNVEDANNNKLFLAVIEKGYLKIMEELLKHISDINKHESKCLHIATKNKQEEIVKLFIRHKANVNDKDIDGKTPIFYAVQNADIKITKLLLDNGTDIKDNSELLNFAVQKQYRDMNDIIEILLIHGADVNTKDSSGKTPIFYAVQNNDLKIFKLLLENGADVKNDCELLNIAVKNRCKDITEILLQYGVDINSTDTHKRTALHFICSNSNYFRNSEVDDNIREEIARLLLNKGVDVYALNDKGFTALDNATKNGYYKVVETLLEHIKFLNFECKTEKVKNNAIPLHLAVFKGYEKIIETFLNFNIDIIDSKDKFGNTALHIASRKGLHKVVEILLDYNSDLNITNNNNYTPLQLTELISENPNNQYCDFFDYDDSNVYKDEYRNKTWNFYKASNTRSIIQILKNHIIKLKAANFYLSKQNLSSIQNVDNDVEYFEECLEEISKTKIEKIGDSNVLFFDILVKDVSQIVIYLKNENLKLILEFGDYMAIFPIYGNMIKSKFLKSMKRKEILDQGNEIFHFFFEHLPELPYNCKEKILGYLSIKDLKLIINACMLLDE